MTGDKTKLQPLPFPCPQCAPGEEWYHKRKQLGEHLPDGKYLCMGCGETSEVKTLPDRPRRRR